MTPVLLNAHLLQEEICLFLKHFCGEHHVRYLTEFSFRYTNQHVTDGERAAIALKGIEGSRPCARAKTCASL